MSKIQKNKFDPQEVFRKIMRPLCFGNRICGNLTCEHQEDCRRLYRDRIWLKQAIEKREDHERKLKFFERKIRLLRKRGVTLG